LAAGKGNVGPLASDGSITHFTVVSISHFSRSGHGYNAWLLVLTGRSFFARPFRVPPFALGVSHPSPHASLLTPSPALSLEPHPSRGLGVSRASGTFLLRTLPCARHPSARARAPAPCTVAWHEEGQGFLPSLPPQPHRSSSRQVDRGPAIISLQSLSSERSTVSPGPCDSPSPLSAFTLGGSASWPTWATPS